MLRDLIDLKVNVSMTFRERGKVVDRYQGHNIFVNVGRNYLAKVVGHPTAYPVSVPYVKYMGIGIGSSEQTINISSAYPALDAAYPGQNVQDDDDPTLKYLERPVLIAGTNDWLKEATYIPPGTPTDNPSTTTAKFTYLFDYTDVNLSGTYSVVPVSEVGLYMSDETATDNPYTGGTAPDYIGADRQTLVAYNGFAPKSKTPLTSIEVEWELKF